MQKCSGKQIPQTWGFHTGTLWEVGTPPVLPSFLRVHVTGLINSFSCSLNSVNSRSAKSGSFLLQRKHLVPSHKREIQNLLLTDKHLRGHTEGTVAQSSLLITMAQVLQLSLFRVAASQTRLIQLHGRESEQNSSISAQILDLEG